MKFFFYTSGMGGETTLCAHRVFTVCCCSSTQSRIHVYKEASLIGFFFPSIVIHFVPSSLQPIIVVGIYSLVIIMYYYFYCTVYAKRHCVLCVLRILITVEKVDDGFEKKPPPSSFLRPPQTDRTL